MRKCGQPDGYDKDCFGDDEDRARLDDMTEKDREAELFKRLEIRETLLTRWRLKKKIDRKSKGGSAVFGSGSDEDDSIDKPTKKRRARKCEM